MTDSLAISLERCLSPAYPWKEKLIILDNVDSTNTYLKQLASGGAPHGTVVLAEQQTAGRGRLGRSFQSPAQMGIYLSMLLRPQCSPGALMHLTCATAVAMCDALQSATGLRPGIKWTNDLIYGNRKVAGILTEMGISADGKLDYAIVGIGVNCCQQEEDFPPELQTMATSLSMVSQLPVFRGKVAAAMMECLCDMSQTLLTGKADMLRSYRRDCITLGKDVSILRADTVSHGKAIDIGQDGDLIVQTPEGIVSVSSGEVSVRGMYGYI